MLIESIVSRCYIVREADKTQLNIGLIIFSCNIHDPIPGRKALRSEQGDGW